MIATRALRISIMAALLCAGVVATAFAQSDAIVGKRYTLESAQICATEDAARELVRIRTTGDFQALPAGCEYLRNFTFTFEAKLPLKAPNRLIIIHPAGKEACFDNVLGEEVPCDVKIVQYTLFTGRRFAEGKPDVRVYLFANDKINLTGTSK